MPDLIGIDLAWQSDKNHSGLVHGSIDDGRVVVHGVLAGLARVDDIVAAFLPARWEAAPRPAGFSTECRRQPADP